MAGCFIGLLCLGDPSGPRIGPLSDTELLKHSGEKYIWVSGRSCDDLAPLRNGPPGQFGFLEAPARTPEPSQCAMMGLTYRTKSK